MRIEAPTLTTTASSPSADVEDRSLSASVEEGSDLPTEGDSDAFVQESDDSVENGDGPASDLRWQQLADIAKEESDNAECARGDLYREYGR